MMKSTKSLRQLLHLWKGMTRVWTAWLKAVRSVDTVLTPALQVRFDRANVPLCKLRTILPIMREDFIHSRLPHFI